MKRNLLYLLPLFLVFMLGEACSPKSDPVPVPTPFGTYSGKFKLLVKNSSKGGYDTVKKDSALILKLSSTGNFAVTGDTATVHAGSKGLYNYDSAFMGFLDSTYRAVVQPKFHLAGTYRYAYSGDRLQLQRTNLAQDSVLFYDFNKTSN